jgi:hypothetical protein
MKRWSSPLTTLFWVFLAAQWALVVTGALLAPPNWTLPLVGAAIICILLAVIAGAVDTWIDRSGADFASSRDLLEIVVVGLLIGWPAIYLEKNHGFNWWLTVSTISVIVLPLWWLYARARKRKLGRFAS